MRLQPLGEKVLVIPQPVEDVTAGGIIVPERAKEKPDRGRVAAAGKDVTEVKVGDIVLYGKNSGTAITDEGVDYLMLKSSDIWAVIG